MHNPLNAIRGIGAERLRLLGFLTGGHFFIHWFQQLFPVVLPSLKAGLGLNDIEVGALNSARQLAMGSLDLPMGMLADSLVRQRAFILGSALAFMGTAYFLMGVAPLFFWALLGSALVGLGSALWHPAAAASLSRRFPDRRATALAIHGMGATLSDTLTPLGVGLLLVALPWHTVLSAQVLPGLFFGIIVWWCLADFFTHAESQGWRGGQLREMAELVRHPLFLRVSAATGLLQMGRLVVISFLPIYLQEHLGYSPFILGVYIALLHAMGTISQPALGYLSDRYGRRAVLLPSFTTLAALFFLLAVVAPGIPLGLVISAIGFFFYTLLNITHATIMDVAGSKIQASCYGLTSLVTQIAVFPTPMIAGLLIGKYGIDSAFLLSGAFVLVGALILAPVKPYRSPNGG